MTFDEAVIELPKLFEGKKFSECAELSKALLKVQPHHPPALVYLACSYEQLGDLQLAGNVFRILSLIFPHNEQFAENVVRTLPADQHVPFSSEREERKKRIAKFPKKPSLDLVDNPAGKMFVPVIPDGDIIGQTIRKGEIFDINIIQCAEKYIRPGTTAIDVGANFGQMSLLFSRMVGPLGQVFSIEADDYVGHVLAENVRVNGIQNIRIVNNAVHNVTGNTVFFPDQDFVRFSTYGSYGIDPQATSGREVTTVKIDDLGIDGPVTFMKVDVQGCDLFAMEGAKNLILKNKMPIIFEYEEQFQADFGTSFQDYVNFVIGIGYEFVKTVDGINYLIAPKTS